jgi:bifunctional non-homologous end joining protein LigD
LVYVAWDALRVSGEDLRGLSLPERRARLRSLLPARDGALVCSEPLEGDLTAVREAMARAGLPGVVARAVRSGGPWVAHGATRETPVALGRALAAPPVVTNRDKVLYPRDGLTKQQVVDYYADVAPVLLAAMRERPVVCQRWPDGIDDFTWFQHRVPPRAPDYVRSVLIEGNRRVLLGNREALLWFANQAALTFHGWAGRVGSLKAPDWAVLDLDPGEATSWAQVIEVALALRRLLELLEVDSVVKTSGQKGLHVLVPLAPGHSNAQAHEFAALVAGVLHRLLPDVVALEAGKARRRGRLFLDHLQNYPGKTLVLPYSLRAVDGACVSAPLGWSEVTPALVPSAFSLRTMRARLDAKGDLFAPALKGRVQLAPVLAKLKG